MALALISTYMVAEVVGGVISGSVALIADAAAIGMALVALAIADRAASAERTFGCQRTEVLATLANTVALWVIAGWILFEAYHRAFSEDIEVNGLPVLLVGLGGLVINILAAELCSLAVLIIAFDRPDSADAFLGIDWTLADPVLSVVIAFLIVYNSRHLMKSVLVVLLEGVPDHIDVYKLCSDIEELEGVAVIHDVHVWTITSGSEAFTAHVLVDPSHADTNRLLEQIKELVHRDFGIGHVTIQLETLGASCAAENHHVEHLQAAERRAR